MFRNPVDHLVAQRLVRALPIFQYLLRHAFDHLLADAAGYRFRFFRLGRPSAPRLGGLLLPPALDPLQKLLIQQRDIFFP